MELLTFLLMIHWEMNTDLKITSTKSVAVGFLKTYTIYFEFRSIKLVL